MIIKINGTENNYLSKNQRISFKSKIVPNEVLKGVFGDTKETLKYLNDNINRDTISIIYTAKNLMNAIKNILNDGKNNLLELTVNKYGQLGYKLNGKKAKINKADRIKIDSLDNRTITNEDFDIINSSICKLKEDLNADYAAKNPDILANLHKNMQEVDNIFFKRTIEALEQLEEQVLKSK